MKKYFAVGLILLISACTNSFLYGQEGKNLDDAYQKYYGKELYCLGYCLLGNGYSEYQVNHEKEYIEMTQVSHPGPKDNRHCMAYDNQSNTRLAMNPKTEVPCWIGTYDTFLNKQILPNKPPYIVDGNQGYVVYDSSIAYNTAGLDRYKFINGQLQVINYPPEGILSVTKAPYTPSLFQTPSYDGYIKISDIGTGKFGSWGTKEEADAFNIKMKNEHEKEKKKEEDKKKQKEQELKNMTKKYGYPWCSRRYLFFSQDKCMEDVDGYAFRVLQQIPDGTLVSFIKSPDYMFFIPKNSKDASLADGSPIYDGLFAVDGTYQYISVLGATRTVKRVKRLK